MGLFFRDPTRQFTVFLEKGHRFREGSQQRLHVTLLAHDFEDAARRACATYMGSDHWSPRYAKALWVREDSTGERVQ